MEHYRGKIETSVNSLGEFDICQEEAGDMIADLRNCGNKEQQEANAKHLVKCWNNYNQLLNTVKTIYDLPHNLVCPSIRNLCKEAIQEAEEN